MLEKFIYTKLGMPKIGMPNIGEGRRLTEVEIEERVVVKRVTSGPKKRLLEMGLTPGTEIIVVRKAPLGDPIDVIVRGYQLSLRLREAECVEVE